MTRLVLFAVTAALMAAAGIMRPTPAPEATSWMDFDYEIPDTATGSVIIIY